MSHKTSLIIPCYWLNQTLVDMTSQCLNSLDFDGELIIVDDGSPLKPYFEYPFILVTNEENKGYAGAVNAGLQQATGDFLVICNNDVEFIQHDWLEQMLKPLYIGYDISSIRTTDADGWITDNKITEGNKFGSIWAMNRAVYDLIGPLDESFGKGYFEDLDYWHRVQDEGLHIAKNHAGLVEHKGRATFNTLGTVADTIYNLAMLKYREKWDDSKLLQQSNGIVLVDKYDLERATPAKRELLLAHEISLNAVKKMWGL